MSLFGSFDSDQYVDVVADNGAWTAFTPSFASGIGAIGNSTYVARYKKIGVNTLAMIATIAIGSTASIDSIGTNFVLLTSPVTPVYSYGAGVYVNVGSGTFAYLYGGSSLNQMGLVRVDPNGRLNFLITVASNNQTLANLTAANMVAGTSALSFHAIYELG